VTYLGVAIRPVPESTSDLLLGLEETDSDWFDAIEILVGSSDVFQRCETAWAAADDSNLHTAGCLPQCEVVQSKVQSQTGFTRMMR